MKRLLSLLIAAVLPELVLLSGCSAPAPISKTGFYLNTTCAVTLYDTQEETLLDGAFDLIEHYEKLFSKTVEGSDVSRINQAEGTPVSVDPETAELLRAAISYSELTGGKFDITIGRVSDLWDFTSESPVPPSKEEIAEALATVGYQNLSVEGNTVTVPAGTHLDLGSIAKGYIADRVADYLRENGVKRAIINLGGNVLTIGEKSDSQPWKVGIQQPFASRSDIIGSVSVSDMSVVTSGIYERCFTYEGAFYHHILDSDTGYPMANNLQAVTILSKSSATADALSTSAFLLGTEQAKALIESLPDTEAIFIALDGTVETTSGIGTQIPFERQEAV